MNIGSTTPASPVAATQPTSDDKRLQLQTMLLRKSLDFQAQGDEQANSMSGKGSIVDLRV